MKLVRWPVEPLEREERGLDERLVLRALEAGLPAPAFRESLPLASKVRKTVLTRVCRVGFAALNRRDMEVLFAHYTPDLEVHGGTTAWAGFGFEAVYRGQDGFLAMLATFDEAFESLHFELREIIDAGGDRFVCRIYLVGTVRGGLTSRQEQWCVYWTRDGRVARQHIFASEKEALDALTDKYATTG